MVVISFVLFGFITRVYLDSLLFLFFCIHLVCLITFVNYCKEQRIFPPCFHLSRSQSSQMSATILVALWISVSLVVFSSLYTYLTHCLNSYRPKLVSSLALVFHRSARLNIVFFILVPDTSSRLPHILLGSPLFLLASAHPLNYCKPEAFQHLA